MTKKEMAARIADLETIIELQNRVLQNAGYYYQPRAILETNWSRLLPSEASKRFRP